MDVIIFLQTTIIATNFPIMENKNKKTLQFSWPYKRKNMWAGGCENYGWGATFPTLLIRNIIGFRELNNENVKGFTIAPALNPDLFKEDEIYKINNLNYRDIKINISYKRTNKKVFVQLNFNSFIHDLFMKAIKINRKLL